MAIDELTPLQEQMLAAKLDHWHGRVRSTERLDRAAATLAICEVYHAMGRWSPKVLFFPSPLACILAWGMLRACGTCDGEHAFLFGQTVRGRIRPIARGRPPDRFWAQISGRLLARISAQIRGRFRDLSDGLTLALQRHVAGSLADACFLDPFLEDVRDALPPELLKADWEEVRLRLPLLLREMGQQLHHMLRGPWECAPAVFQDCCASIGALRDPAQTALLTGWLDQSRYCHWWLPCAGLVLASDRPCRLSVDSRGRFHDTHAAALEYRDGYAIHAWHGVAVEPWIITHPGAITVRRIERESNAEVRRVMLDRYGWSRYMADCHAQVVDRILPHHPIAGLRGARLLRKELPGEPEPLVYLEMVNSTPQPDGTYRRYLERIDPKAYGGLAGRLCHAAMASRWHYRDDSGRLQQTFANWRDYEPALES